MSDPIAETCCLCQRNTLLTFHHLIPRKVHRRTKFRKNYSREDLAQGIYVCKPCHRGIHKMFDEMTLAKHYDSLEKLMQSEDLMRHVAWVAKQKC